MEYAVEKIINRIKELIQPDSIIVYGSKKDVINDGVKDIDICIVTKTADKTELEHMLYITIDSEISFDIIIYTPDEWDVLSADPQSFAHRIQEKGIQVYGRETKQYKG